MEEAAGWIAPIATTIAAMMTAANLGARVTGWGFVVFTVGSICWTIIGVGSGQTNLLAANAFLTVVNLVGIWRWLGRKVKYQEGAAAIAEASVAAPVPTLLAVGALVGKPVQDREGSAIGLVVDAMIACDARRIASVLVREGGIGGVGERLHLLETGEFGITPDGITTRLTTAELRARPAAAAYAA